MKFTAGRGWGSACSLLTFPCGFLQFASIGQQRSVIHELAPDVIKIASTERHASTKFFALWKSFQEIFSRYFDFNREEKFLSSSEIVNAARVVQKRSWVARHWSLARN